MARDDVDPSLILTERCKRKMSSYATNEDNCSADKADTIKCLRKTIKSTESQSYSDDKQNEDGGTYHHEDNMDTRADSTPTDDAGSDLSRNAKKKASKKKKKQTLSSRDGRTVKKQSSCTLSSHDASDADESEEDEIEVIEKPEEEPEEELGE